MSLSLAPVSLAKSLGSPTFGAVSQLVYAVNTSNRQVAPQPGHGFALHTSGPYHLARETAPIVVHAKGQQATVTYIAKAVWDRFLELAGQKSPIEAAQEAYAARVKFQPNTETVAFFLTDTDFEQSKGKPLPHIMAEVIYPKQHAQQIEAEAVMMPKTKFMHAPSN